MVMHPCAAGANIFVTMVMWVSLTHTTNIFIWQTVTIQPLTIEMTAAIVLGKSHRTCTCSANI